MPKPVPDSPISPLFVRIRQLPAILGISERKAKQLVAAGVLPSVKLDGCVLIPVSGLTEFAERITQQAA